MEENKTTIAHIYITWATHISIEPIEVGTVEFNGDPEDIWNQCNWGAWSKTGKPEGANIPFDYCHSWDIIARVEDQYYVFSSGSTTCYSNIDDAMSEIRLGLGWVKAGTLDNRMWNYGGQLEMNPYIEKCPDIKTQLDMRRFDGLQVKLKPVKVDKFERLKFWKKWKVYKHFKYKSTINKMAAKAKS